MSLTNFLEIPELNCMHPDFQNQKMADPNVMKKVLPPPLFRMYQRKSKQQIDCFINKPNSTESGPTSTSQDRITSTECSLPGQACSHLIEYIGSGMLFTPKLPLQSFMEAGLKWTLYKLYAGITKRYFCVTTQFNSLRS